MNVTALSHSSSSSRKILIELAGASGVGKTTLAPLLARRLRGALGERHVAALPEKDLPRHQRRWRHMQRKCWKLLNPRLVLAAWRTSRVEPRIARLSVWLDVFSTLGIGRGSLKRGIRAALVDQGCLRLSMTAAHAPLLPQELLPDLVIQLVAEPAVLEQRRILRAKTKHRLLEGADRLVQARLSRQRLEKLPPAQVSELLFQFGGKFCQPPLSEEEVRQVLAEPPAQPGTEPAKPALTRCAPATREALRARGVLWVEVDNSGQDGLEPVVEQCLKIILDHLGGH